MSQSASRPCWSILIELVCMCVYVCMCVCVCVCFCFTRMLSTPQFSPTVSVCGCERMYVCVSLHACVWMCANVCVSVCQCVYVYVCLFTRWTWCGFVPYRYSENVWTLLALFVCTGKLFFTQIIVWMLSAQALFKTSSLVVSVTCHSWRGCLEKLFPCHYPSPFIQVLLYSSPFCKPTSQFSSLQPLRCCVPFCIAPSSLYWTLQLLHCSHYTATTTLQPLHCNHYTATTFLHCTFISILDFATTTLQPLRCNHYTATTTLQPLHCNHYTATTTPLHVNHYTATTTLQPLHCSHYTATSTLQPLHCNHYVATTTLQPLHCNHYTATTTLQPLRCNHYTVRPLHCATTTLQPLHCVTTTLCDHYTATTTLQPLHCNHYTATTTLQPLHCNHYTVWPLHHCSPLYLIALHLHVYAEPWIQITTAIPAHILRGHVKVVLFLK